MKIQKKSIFLLSILSLSLTLTSCSFKSANKKPKLELAFDNKIEFVDISYLEDAIGNGSGKNETFGEQKSILLYFAEEDCSTCKKIQPVIEKWISQTGIKVYGYEENSSTDLIQKQSMLKKLGSTDGVNLTAGRLIAFVNGKRVDSIAGTYDLENSAKINKFVKKHFQTTPKSSIKAKSLKKLNGINELRECVANNEEFILYFERYSCPDCRQLSDPNRQNVITEIAKNYKGNIYKIVTEDSMLQLLEPVIVDDISYSSSFEYLTKSGTDALLWPKNENLKKKTEYLEMLLALNQITPVSTSDEDFLKAVYIFARNRTNKFLYSDRNVPSFAVHKDIENPDYEGIQAILNSAYLESKMTDENTPLHRQNFIFYFSPDNTELSGEQYQEYLIQYLNKMQ